MVANLPTYLGISYFIAYHLLLAASEMTSNVSGGALNSTQTKPFTFGLVAPIKRGCTGAGGVQAPSPNGERTGRP